MPITRMVIFSVFIPSSRVTFGSAMRSGLTTAQISRRSAFRESEADASPLMVVTFSPTGTHPSEFARVFPLWN
jgi:hypothetical protein